MCFEVGEVCHFEVRMNPESKMPSPEIPEGDENFRLLVMGHLEPDEWETGAHDAPVVRDSTFMQLIAAGLDEDDTRLKGSLKKNSASLPTGNSDSCGESSWPQIKISLMLKLDSTLEKTPEGTHRNAPRKLKVKSRKSNVESSVDKVLAMQDQPNATRHSLRRLWPNSSVATLRGYRML